MNAAPSARRLAASPLEYWAAASLQKLAALDEDRAADKNGVGFSKLDTDLGCSLARQAVGGMTDLQWSIAVRIASRYHRQVGPPPAGAPQAEEHPPTPAAAAFVSPPSAPEPAPAAAAPARAVTLSADQQLAHDAVVAWFKTRAKPLLTLGGLAGTGKTTLTAAIAATLREERPGLRVAFVCYTGKAASVLKAKLARAGALGADYCGTIHGLIYMPETNDKGEVVGWTLKPFLDADLVILDEASMAGSDVFADLQAYGKPILAVGDHGQLPPIQGSMNLMAHPELRLEHIHRQALDNPIVRAAMMARNGEKIPVCDWGAVVKTPFRDIIDKLDNLRDVMFLCGTNRTRVALNARIRAKLGLEGRAPVAGDKVICLRNDRKKGIFNGMIGFLRHVEPAGDHHLKAAADMDGIEKPVSLRLNRHQFGADKTLKGDEVPGLSRGSYGDLFDFGYALTVHKSQGSEAKTVVVFDECDWMKEEDSKRRWRYTAWTRASEKLIIIGR